jgi:acyl carrier protein
LDAREASRKEKIQLNIDPQAVQAEIITMICDELDIGPDQIRPSTLLVEDLKADSLALISLVMTVEEKFDIRVPEEVLRSFKKIEDITKYVETQVKMSSTETLLEVS